MTCGHHLQNASPVHQFSLSFASKQFKWILNWLCFLQFLMGYPYPGNLTDFALLRCDNHVLLSSVVSKYCKVNTLKYVNKKFTSDIWLKKRDVQPSSIYLFS